MTDRLNPEALSRASDAVTELYADGYCPKAEDAAEVAVSAYLAALPAPRTIETVEEIPATIQVISWEEEPEHECWKLSPDETFVGLIVKSGRSWSPADQYTLRVERTPTEGGGE